MFRSIILLIFFQTLGYASAQSLKDVRSEFHKVVLEPSQSKHFHEFMEEIEGNSTTLRAYKAVSHAILAQSLWNPFSKLSQVMKYDQQIESLVEEDPTNIEIRFLRLAIECHLPSFLGMSTHVKEDSQMIINNMSSIPEIQIDKSYGQYIFYFLLETNLITPDQISLMEHNLSMN
ncbi:MAG: hypothetical protein HRT61_08560 [Ekhidna sp.]|nr:hypothetical protein [Ekhidna sp.]